MPFCIPIAVRSFELDSFGHVNNSVYLNYLEEARGEYLKEIGLTFNDLKAHGVHLVIVEAHVVYHAPAHYGDVLLVQGCFTEIRAASLTIHYTLTTQAEGKKIATASTRAGSIEASTGRPIRMPEPFRSSFQRAVALSESKTN